MATTQEDHLDAGVLFVADSYDTLATNQVIPPLLLQLITDDAATSHRAGCIAELMTDDLRHSFSEKVFIHPAAAAAAAAAPSTSSCSVDMIVVVMWFIEIRSRCD
jgi:hypothetical protein